MLMKMRREDGVALVTVMMVTFLLLTLVASALSYAMGSQTLSRHEQDWNAAMAAAEAGLDDYLFRMNENDNYWQYSKTNPPPDGNQAFSHWVPVPGPTSQGSFRYDIDTSQLATDGTIKITATGRVLHVTRTIQATFRRRSFLDFLYYTDFETKDPAAYDSGDDYTPAQAQTYCAKHYYQGRDIAGRVDFSGDTDGNVCTEISFISQDTINGPMHTNDAIRVSGSPHFNGDTSTSYQPASGNRWVGSGTPVFAKPGDPQYADPLTMPPNNISIKSETSPPETGCLFTGPTAISLRSNGTMDVISPFTKNKYCTVTSNPSTSLYSRFTITNMALPANGVIYVQNVPSSSSDANYTNGCPSPFNNQEAVGGSGSSNPNRAHPLGFPQNNDAAPAGWYGCRNGDVFLQGTLNGRLTIAADNNIVLFGSTIYNGGAGGTDLLGLVANNYIEVYHPDRTDGSSTNCDGGFDNGNDGCNLKLPSTSTSSTTPSLFSGTTAGTSTMATVLGTRALRNPSFSAALITVQHSFHVQNYADGDGGVLGTLTLTGAIAQRYRGPVGTFSGSSIDSGYAKSYSYDQRLKYQSPPHFLDPVASAWQIVTWAEVPVVYAASAP